MSDWLFYIDERLRELSAKGDKQERLNSFVDFELFRGDLERAVPQATVQAGHRGMGSLSNDEELDRTDVKRGVACRRHLLNRISQPTFMHNVLGMEVAHLS